MSPLWGFLLVAPSFSINIPPLTGLGYHGFYIVCFVLKADDISGLGDVICLKVSPLRGSGKRVASICYRRGAPTGLENR